MKHLKPPCTDAVDDKVLNTLCKDDPWKPHKDPWLGAYAAYRQARSDPWQVEPHAFDPDIADVQYKLYDNRKSNSPIRQIRQTKGLLSCPMCGSPTTGSVDHLLPRAVYPEFSIMRANLVPACTHCNSASKGNKHRGPAQPERFIHPYYDTFADQPLWCVRINPPFAAATFDAEALATLPEPMLSVVRYHLSHVLGEAFKRRMESFWSTYPGEIKVAANGGAITVASTTSQITLDLQRRVIPYGVNGWEPAFLRGLLGLPDAIAHVAQRAFAYPA